MYITIKCCFCLVHYVSALLSLPNNAFRSRIEHTERNVNWYSRGWIFVALLRRIIIYQSNKRKIVERYVLMFQTEGHWHSVGGDLEAWQNAVSIARNVTEGFLLGPIVFINSYCVGWLLPLRTTSFGCFKTAVTSESTQLYTTNKSDTCQIL